MKLKTKLIPLASVAAVCATVAPITLTSCGNNGLVNLMEEYKPSFTKLSREEVENGALTTVEANELYSEWISENPNNLSEEYYWSTSTAVYSVNSGKARTTSKNVVNPPLVEVSGLKYGKDNEKISDVSIKTKKIKFDVLSTPYETTIVLASFNLQMERIYTIERTNGETKTIDERISKGTISFVDVPFWITLSSVTSSLFGWTFEPMFFWIMPMLYPAPFLITDPTTAPSWSIDFNLENSDSIKVITSDGEETEKLTQTVAVLASDDNIRDIASDSRESFMNLVTEQFYSGLYMSYYLYDIGYAGIGE